MARSFLLRKELPEGRLEAELLVARALEMDRLGLFMSLDRPVSGAEVDLARDYLVRRGRREPTAYIIGRREFYCRDFGVGPGVLIPRPETELLVDRARELAAKRPADSPLRIAELGTGSGCLAVTLALELPRAQVIATDISKAALELARTNGQSLGAQVEFVEGDGLAPLVERAERDGPYDMLLSNPPYIGADEAAQLAPEVREHEPPEALFAPAGERDYWLNLLLTEGVQLLAPGGHLLVELGASQGGAARGLCADLGLACDVRPDLAGLDRVLELTREAGQGHWARSDQFAAAWAWWASLSCQASTYSSMVERSGPAMSCRKTATS